MAPRDVTMQSTLQKKYYIEFVGQHTAGKTRTIHEIVDRQLLAPKIAVYPQKLYRSPIRFFFAVPLLVLQNIRHLWFVIFFLMRYTSWSWINYHAVGRHLLKMVLLHPFYETRYNFDVWLKDDMLHLLPRLDFKKDVDVTVALRKYFLHFSYLYDGIVYIDIPYEIMKQRFERRFRERSIQRRNNRTPVYERAFRQNIILRGILSEQTAVPLLILDGTNGISDNARHVATFINTHVYGT